MPSRPFGNIQRSILLVLFALAPNSWCQSVALTESAIPLGPRQITGPVYGVTLNTIENLKDTIESLRLIPYFPTARIVFRYGVPPSLYALPIQRLRPHTYLMGQIADSQDMRKYTVATFKKRAESLVSAFHDKIDIWEIGNEVNGKWLGTNTAQKIVASYETVKSVNGITALTFFYMGEPDSAANCIDAPGNDIFTWINNTFKLHEPFSKRDPKLEKMRMGLNYVLVSYYVDGCPILTPDWPTIFKRLAATFPNAKIGFGELGTAQPQMGSALEANTISRYYPLAKNLPLPTNFIGGYFWWYFAEEMVPYTRPLMKTLMDAIKSGPPPDSHPPR